jgi:hypothetical protein
MYLLSRQLFDPGTAIAATLIWLISPQVFRITGWLRPYELISLITICFAYVSIQITDRNRGPTGWTYFWLSFLVCTGFLLHFMFVLTLASGVLLALTVRLGNRRLSLLAWAASLGILAAILIHPRFYLSFGYHAEIRTPFEWKDAIQRLSMTTSALLGFFGWRPSWTGAPSIIAIISLAILGGIYAFYRFILAVIHRDRSLIERVILCFLAAPTLVYILAFNLAIVDAHAMSYRYLAFAWPFVSIGVCAMVGTALRSWSGPALLLVACAGSVVFAVLAEKRSIEPPKWIDTISEAHTIVFDDRNPGRLIPYLMHVDDGAHIFVGSRSYLLRNPDLWLPVTGDPVLLVSRTNDEAGESYQDELVSLISRTHRVETLRRGRSGNTSERFLKILPSGEG